MNRTYSVGDRVVAVKDFGGFTREAIKKGTQGVITETSWGKPTRVLFHVEGSGPTRTSKLTLTTGR